MFSFIILQLVKDLKGQLLTLPNPKNDYEIFVPDDDLKDGEDPTGDKSGRPEDRDDIEKRNEAEKKKRRMEEFKKLCKAVQRDLPRPLDVNMTILRPSSMIDQLTDLQKAEELIKKEMVLMMHHDALVAPAENQVVYKKGQASIHNQSHHLGYLEKYRYDEVSPEDMDLARELLQQEMQTVKKGMGHGDIPLPVYTQVWEECLSQVRY